MGQRMHQVQRESRRRQLKVWEGCYLLSLCSHSSSSATPSPRGLAPVTTHPPWVDGRYRIAFVGPPIRFLLPEYAWYAAVDYEVPVTPSPGMGSPPPNIGSSTYLSTYLPTSFWLANTSPSRCQAAEIPRQITCSLDA